MSVFQPREEAYPSGAHDIVTSGVLRQEDVRAVLAVHVQPAVPPGWISVGSGAVNAAADEFEIVVHGRGGHAAYPHQAVNPISTLAQLSLALDQLVGRLIDPTHPAVLTVGALTAGAAANVIPGDGWLRGSFRTTTEDDRATLSAAIELTADRIAEAHGARAEVTVTRGEPVLVNDASLARRIEPLLPRVGLTVCAEPFRSCGSDDFAFYAADLPILMMYLGVRTEGVEEPQPPLHHPHFLPADEVVGKVAAAMCAGFVGALTAPAGVEVTDE